jgi:hypothetical protein
MRNGGSARSTVIPSRADGEGPRARSADQLAPHNATSKNGVPFAQAVGDADGEGPRARSADRLAPHNATSKNGVPFAQAVGEQL